MKKSWMEIFFLTGAVSVFGMVVSYALFKVGSPVMLKASLSAATFTASVLIVMSIISFVIDEKERRVSTTINITCLANCCACFAAAVIASHIVVYVIVSICLFVVAGIIASSAFANMTGTKKLPTFFSLVTQAAIIERVMRESWKLSLACCVVFLLMYLAIQKRPQWFVQSKPKAQTAV